MKPEEVTRLLGDASAGDQAAFDRVFEVVYEELHRLARHVRKGRASETMNTTALIHEAYLHLLPSAGLHWEGRGHFMGVAARAMRQVLVRAAEKRTAAKRGSGEAATGFDEMVHRGGAESPSGGFGSGTIDPESIVVLDRALSRLEELSPRQARTVECRFFAGLSVEETAEALAVSEPTVKRDWKIARAWLAREVG